MPCHAVVGVWADVKNLAEYDKHRPSAQRARKRSANPLLEGINTFFPDFHKQIAGADDFLPSRYLLYSPLLLLPAAFEVISPMWEAEYAALDPARKNELFRTIAAAFTGAGQRVTHIGLNARIPQASRTDAQLPNILRSPSGFVPLYGEWGPLEILNGKEVPTTKDFESAFWVSTRQDHGITQVWAPRWTMFSQGNLSEKKRILGTAGQDAFNGQTADDIAMMQVADLYVGIGYFTLCYLARGVERVWGWDLNPWSIEGLRRGCEANGWKCVVVEATHGPRYMQPSSEALAKQLHDEEELPRDQRTRCIAFLGSNIYAASTVEAIRKELTRHQKLRPVAFDHVNLGLLPDSKPSWREALKIITPGGRLHVHQNVDISDDVAPTRCRGELEALGAEVNLKYSLTLLHTERVKMYGPGVRHCVFDIQMDPKQ